MTNPLFEGCTARDAARNPCTDNASHE
jgi:hypothetical protein